MGPVPRPASGVLHGHHGRITPPARRLSRRFSKHLPGFRCSFHLRGNRICRSPAHLKSRCSGHKIPVLRFRYGSYRGEVRICCITKALKSSAGNSSELWHATAPSIPNFAPPALFFLAADGKKARRIDFETTMYPTGIPVDTYLQGEKGAAGSIDCGSAFFIIQEIRFLRKPAHLPDGYSPFCKKVST